MAVIKTSGSDFELGTVPTRAQYEALASARRSQFAGSGVENWAPVYRNYDANGSFSTFSGDDSLAEFNMAVPSGASGGNGVNTFLLNPTIYNVHGYKIHAYGANRDSGREVNVLNLPDAPSGPNQAPFPNTNNGWYSSGTYSSAVSFNNVNNTVSVDGTNANSSCYARVNLSSLVDNELIYVTFKISITSGSVELQQSTSINSIGFISESGTYTLQMNWSDASDSIGFQFGGGTVCTISEFYVTRASDISRQDIVTLEVWNEKISDLDVVYPYGGVQYGFSSWNGVSLVTTNSPASYTAFGEWDKTTLRGGRGLIWSTASDTDKMTMINDPRNNIFVDGDDLIQTRWRYRVSKPRPDGAAHCGNGYFPVNDPDWQYQSYFDGLYARGKISTDAKDWKGDPATYTGGYENDQDVLLYGPRFVQKVMQSAYPNLSSGTEQELGLFSNRRVDSRLSHDGIAYNIPIATIQRNNTGGYHPIHNPEGTRAFRSTTNTSTSTREWHRSDLRYGQIEGLGQCFNADYIAPDGWEGDGLTGGTAPTLNQPFAFHSDQPQRYHFRDFRNVAHKVKDYKQFVDEIVAAYDSGGATLGRMSEMITGDFEKMGWFVRTELDNFHGELVNWQWRQDKFLSGDLSRRGGANNPWNDGRPVTWVKAVGDNHTTDPTVNLVVRQSYWDSSNSQQYHIHTQYNSQWYRYGTVGLEGSASSGWTVGDWATFHFRRYLGDGQMQSAINYGLKSNTGSDRYNCPTYSQRVPVVDYIGNVANMPKNWAFNGARINLIKRDFKETSNWPTLDATQNFYRLSQKYAGGTISYVVGNDNGPISYGVYSSGFDEVQNAIPVSGVNSSNWIMIFYMAHPIAMETPIHDLHSYNDILAVGDLVINNIRAGIVWGGHISQNCLMHYDMLRGGGGGPFKKTISGSGLQGYGYPMLYGNNNYFKYNTDGWTVDGESGLHTTNTLNGNTIPQPAVMYVPAITGGSRSQYNTMGHLNLVVTFNEMRWNISSATWSVSDGGFAAGAFNTSPNFSNRTTTSSSDIVTNGIRAIRLPFFIDTERRSQYEGVDGDRML
jgi:hypothetical protein